MKRINLVVAGMAAGIVLAGSLGSMAGAVAEPIPLTPYSAAEEAVDAPSESGEGISPAGSGSSFSGPGFAGSSTTGSSGSFNPGSSDGKGESGSAETAIAGFLGRIIRGVVTGS